MGRGTRLLYRSLAAHKALTALCVVSAVITVVASTTIPALTGKAIDTATAHTPEALRHTIATIVIAAVVSFAFQALRKVSSGALALSVQHTLRVDLLANLQRLDGPGQDRLVTGQVVSRAISDLGGVHTVLIKSPIGLSRLLQIILVTGFLLGTSPLLTAISLAIIPILVLLARRSGRTLFAATWTAQQASAEVATHVEQNVTGVRIVKAFAQEDREVARLDALSRALYAVKLRSAKLTARYQPALTELPRLALVITIVVGAVLAQRGFISIGDYFASAAYLTTLAQSVSALTLIAVNVQLGMSSVVRIDEVLDLRPEQEEPEHPAVVPTGPLGLEIRDVYYGSTLAGASLTLKPGEVTALIGPPGSGKTLLTELVGGFYAPTSGSIALTGAGEEIPYPQLRKRDLRSAVCCVFDDAFLLNASIRDNIRLGAPDTVSEEEIITAATLAQAHDFITAFPSGYDSVVGEQGLTLSGGQRQRIALARALLRRPRVLIVDDATSALDARTEHLLIDSLREDLGTMAVLVIAHRRSTLALADRVAIIDRGRIELTGTYSEIAETEEFQAIMRPKPSDLTLDEHHAEPSRELLWPAVDTTKTEHFNASTPSYGRGGPMRDIASTPELLERVSQLPPADEEPGISPASVVVEGSRFRITHLLAPVSRLIAAAAALMVVGVVAGLVFPRLMSAAIDRGVVAQDNATLVAVAGIGLLVVAVAWGSLRAQTVITARCGERLLYALRVRSFQHLNSLSMSYFEARRGGAIMTRMTTDIDQLSVFLQTGLAQMVVALGTLVGVLGMLVYTDVALAALAGIAIPVIGVITVVFRSVSRRLYRAAREEISHVNATFQEAISALRVTQMHDATSTMLEDLKGSSLRYRRLRLRAQVAAALYFPGIQAISQLTSALIVGFGAARVAEGALSPGVLVAFLMYLTQMFGPLQTLGMVFDSWQRARVSFDRITDLLSQESDVRDEGDRVDAHAASHSLALEEVTFAYPETDHPVAQGLSVALPPHSTTVIVGPTGAGKSTIIKLLARFYDPNEGRVTASGVDVRDFRLPVWRRAMVQVPQDAHLFIGSVADNIRYGTPGATDGEVEDAVRRIGALSIIAGIAGGFNAHIGERGRGLSSGQRQIVALARAELSRPLVLLLDEATASLDPTTEATFLDAADRAAQHDRLCGNKSRTTVIVAHRLAVAPRADHIVVLDRGRVVEQGDHDTLLNRGGLYAEMWELNTEAP
ncbi:ABC transporter ATP-binding protein [Corynebacterium uterequi]|uniref:ABC-type multidrug transport system, ATPase and permease component n=1 Tax=Corynebacterium uterequi TaxID=1072256 RepID=A0A0G3HC18_9CORY|nr:ABC transporter ATP-binding protein [Corynebacterium uterequi]AKK10844.1 ABC-type multidrug transport system, ATPase and permease component [Corynebacterium uterequi]